MAAWRYEISLLVLKNLSTVEEKFRISAWSCNILYISRACSGIAFFSRLKKSLVIQFPCKMSISNSFLCTLFSRRTSIPRAFSERRQSCP